MGVAPAAAIVAAGGAGERAGSSSGVLKQFRPLGNRPVFQWSLASLIRAECSPIIVVVPADQLDTARALTDVMGDVHLIAGGTTRQESVANGLAEVRTDKVVVHDAARPFADVDVIKRVLEALISHDAALAAVPVADTLKEAEAGHVTTTIPRDGLWLAQTPQGFRTEVLRAAHRAAREESYEATDDAELIERYGLGDIAIVQGARWNIKLTYEEDFELAEQMIKARL